VKSECGHGQEPQINADGPEKNRQGRQDRQGPNSSIHRFHRFHRFPGHSIPLSLDPSTPLLINRQGRQDRQGTETAEASTDIADPTVHGSRCTDYGQKPQINADGRRWSGEEPPRTPRADAESPEFRIQRPEFRVVDRKLTADGRRWTRMPGQNPRTLEPQNPCF